MDLKKLEVSAFSLEEAKESALKSGITVIKNVTRSYNASDKSIEFDEFAKSILEKNKMENTTGVGCIIVVEPGSVDTRKRPYKFINNPVKGPVRKKRVFEVCRVSDGVVLGSTNSKSNAIRLAKNLIKTTHTDLVCKVVYRVVKNREVSFTLNYTPSPNTKKGKYIVFGY